MGGIPQSVEATFPTNDVCYNVDFLLEWCLDPAFQQLFRDGACHEYEGRSLTTRKIGLLPLCNPLQLSIASQEIAFTAWLILLALIVTTQSPSCHPVQSR